MALPLCIRNLGGTVHMVEADGEDAIVKSLVADIEFGFEINS